MAFTYLIYRKIKYLKLTLRMKREKDYGMFIHLLRRHLLIFFCGPVSGIDFEYLQIKMAGPSLGNSRACRKRT